MTFDKKGLITAVIFGGAALAAIVLSAKKESRYVETKSSPDGVVELDRMPESEEVKIKIQEAALKMAKWIVEKKDYIEGAGAVIGLVASMVNLKNAAIPKKDKAFVTMDKDGFDNYISDCIKSGRHKIECDFLDHIVDMGGKTMTRDDGVKLVMTVVQKGEMA